MSEANGSAVDKPRIEAAVREILLAIGEDPDRDGLQDTPARVARAYEEFFSGLHADPADVLGTTFEYCPFRDGAGEGYPVLFHVRASPGAFPRGWRMLGYIPRG